MKSKLVEDNSKFPISQTKTINGSRRLVREKVMQILFAHFISNIEIDLLFDHIFCRDFNIEDDTDNNNSILSSHKKSLYSDSAPILTNEEIINLHADTKIIWPAENLKFGKTLIDNVLKNHDFIVDTIKEASENWNIDRISIIDKTLICMTAVEFICFPDIPIKASMNEAIELAKVYSSEKSYFFINGIIEKIKIIFTEKGLINKYKSTRGKS